MIHSSSCPQWQPDRPGPARDYDGLALVTPLTGTRSAIAAANLIRVFASYKSIATFAESAQKNRKEVKTLEREKLRSSLEGYGGIAFALTALLGGVTAVVTGVKELREQLSEFVEHPWDLWWPWLLIVLFISSFCLLGFLLVRRRRRLSSPLSGVDLFRIDPTNVQLLVGRDEDLERLKKRITADALVFLVGESGCGKSALLRAGIRKTVVSPKDLPRFTSIYRHSTGKTGHYGPFAKASGGFCPRITRRGDCSKRVPIWKLSKGLLANITRNP